MAAIWIANLALWETSGRIAMDSDTLDIEIRGEDGKIHHRTLVCRVAFEIDIMPSGEATTTEGEPA